MERVRGILSSFLNTRRDKSERSALFLEDESKSPEEFVAERNGDRCSIPLLNFSVRELTRATRNFDSRHLLGRTPFYSLHRGSLGKRPILVKKYQLEAARFPRITALPAHDIAITSQMSSHKNAFPKLIGYCLEFKNPALVYEDTGSIEILSHSLYTREGNEAQNESLSWRNRLRIATDIADTVVCLHTAFSTPIVHRNLNPQEVIVDRYGGAKLLDFSFSIAIPPGESQVEDDIVGTRGYKEPQYSLTGILTEKTDVYEFGMILLELLTGQRVMDPDRGDDLWLLSDLVRDYVDEGRLNEIVDIRIRGGGGGGAEEEQQFQAFVAVALRCLREEREDRPEMVDVAKELKRIQLQEFVQSSSLLNHESILPLVHEVSIYLQDVRVHVLCPLLTPRGATIRIISAIGKTHPILEWSFGL